MPNDPKAEIELFAAVRRARNAWEDASGAYLDAMRAIMWAAAEAEPDAADRKYLEDEIKRSWDADTYGEAIADLEAATSGQFPDFYETL